MKNQAQPIQVSSVAELLALLDAMPAVRTSNIRTREQRPLPMESARQNDTQRLPLCLL